VRNQTLPTQALKYILIDGRCGVLQDALKPTLQRRIALNAPSQAPEVTTKQVIKL
jgi:hypothetical protein